jgi:hypothetical protein
MPLKRPWGDVSSDDGDSASEAGKNSGSSSSSNNHSPGGTRARGGICTEEVQGAGSSAATGSGCCVDAKGNSPGLEQHGDVDGATPPSHHRIPPSPSLPGIDIKPMARPGLWWLNSFNRAVAASRCSNFKERCCARDITLESGCCGLMPERIAAEVCGLLCALHCFRHRYAAV